MFFSSVVPYKKLESFKYEFLRKKGQRFCKVGVCAWLAVMLFICILIMSLMIVKVSSAASFYQNQKAPTPTTNHITRHNQTLIVADPTSTPAALAAAVAHHQQQHHHHQTELLLATEFIRPRQQQPIKAPKHQKLKHIVMRNHQQQQQQHYLQQHMPMMPILPMQMHQQLQQQQQQQQQIHSHAITGETAYLLERSDSNAHEQPIYGTWLAKAKRPQPPLVAAAAESAAATTAKTAVASTSAAMSVHDDSDAVGSIRRGRRRDNGGDIGVGDNIAEHYYERLPRRAATMTPKKSEIHEQMPRPPRFASRQPSMLQQRQVMKTNALDRNDGQPKPFHFPHDGPLPHEFTKLQPHPESERVEVNNIQDILKNLHLGNMPTKTPQLVMMPTGLHIAGSFKNLKSSGIGHFFRGKRQKKHLQLAIPMQMAPMHWMGGYHQPHMISYAAPHQRIAMDQFYPFKPRSPHDINLLAMQQQQMQTSHIKSKKKRKTPMLAHSPSLLLQHSNQRPFTADPYMQSYPPYMFALNQSQKSKTKRVPFKLNLDIYPIATPTKDYKASAFTLDEAKILTTLRPATAMRNPFAEHYVFPAAPPAPSATALHFSGPRDNHNYNPPPFNPSQPDMHQSNIYQNLNPFYTNPSQLPTKQQTHTQQSTFTFPNQQQNNFVTPVEHHVNAPHSAASNANPSSNQLLVHLNVFPKQNSPTSSSSNNPFYTSSGNNNPSNSINRQSTIGVGSSQVAHIIPKVKSRCKNKTAAVIHQQPVSRSDNVMVESSIQPLIDFEHPIVAAEVPNAQPLVDNKLEEVPNSQQTAMEMRSNFNYNSSTNVDQLAAEAQTASLFRFPVEDLIQFQVDDAL